MRWLLWILWTLSGSSVLVSWCLGVFVCLCVSVFLSRLCVAAAASVQRGCSNGQESRRRAPPGNANPSGSTGTGAVESESAANAYWLRQEIESRALEWGSGGTRAEARMQFNTHRSAQASYPLPTYLPHLLLTRPFFLVPAYKGRAMANPIRCSSRKKEQRRRQGNYGIGASTMAQIPWNKNRKFTVAPLKGIVGGSDGRGADD